jgi:hypothetical protein
LKYVALGIVSSWTRRLEAALKKYHVPVFRVSEYNQKERHQKPDSPYNGWSEAKKKRFLRLLIGIATEIPLAGYGSMVETKAWDSILDDYTKVGIPHEKKHRQELIYNPYISCFQNFFAKFPKFLDNAVNLLLSKHIPVSKVTSVFDHQKDFGPAALKGYELSQESLKDDRLGSFASSNSKCASYRLQYCAGNGARGRKMLGGWARAAFVFVAPDPPRTFMG